jgi:glycosyltransferase involved in cell wall biosynthesis
MFESVFTQTFVDWEIVVSDDETPSGEAWSFLNSLARADARIRAIKNDGPHGAVSNHNLALRASCGEWIKPLHDDDVLKPNCLEVVARIVSQDLATDNEESASGSNVPVCDLIEPAPVPAV